MVRMLICSGEPEEYFSVLLTELSAVEFQIKFTGRGVDTLNAVQSMGNESRPDFILFAPDISLDTINQSMQQIRALSRKIIPVVAFHREFDRDKLLACSKLYNHFILDLADAEIIRKKLSNLRSIHKIRQDREGLKQVEKDLQAESAKLVEVNVNNVELLSEVNNKNKLLEIARRNIRNMIDNLNQGFFTIDREGKIQDGYTRSVETLFGREPSGLDLAELLELPEESRETFRQWLEITFAERIPFDDASGLGEKSFSRDGSFIELDYKPIRDDTGRIDKVIVIATDKTKEKQFEEQAAREQAFARLILRIIQDRNGFYNFVEESRSILGSMEEMLKQSVLDIDAFFRGAHTLKGNSAAYHFLDVSREAHCLEDFLSEMRNHADAGRQAGLDAETREAVKKQFDHLRESFEATMKTVEEAIGDQEDSLLRKINLDPEVFRKLEERIVREWGDVPGLREAFYDTFYHDYFHKLLRAYGPVLAGVARRLGKKIVVKMQTDRVRVYPKPYNTLLQSLIHLLRNSVDHGIEFPDERIARGKPAKGTILLRAVRLKDGRSFRLAIRDDGAGIDEDIVRQRAVEKGIATEEVVAAMSPEEIRKLIFHPGFSTRRAVSEWSGRGIGMSAVEEAVTKLGGSIQVLSQKDAFTEFRLDLPLLYKDPLLVNEVE